MCSAWNGAIKKGAVIGYTRASQMLRTTLVCSMNDRLLREVVTEHMDKGVLSRVKLAVKRALS